MGEPDSQPSGHQVTEKASSGILSGTRWLSLSMLCLTIISFVQNILFSRLLTPRELGLIGMIWSVLGLGQLFYDMGLSNALVQRTSLTRRQISTIYWLTVACGCVLMGLVLMAGTMMANFYKEPELKQLVPWVGVSFLLQSIGQPYWALVQRNFRFRAMAIIELCAALTSFSVAIFLANRGFGPMALITGSLVMAGAKTMFSVAAGHDLFRPRFEFRFDDIRDMFQFGVFQMGDKITNYLASNVDYILIGRYWGPAILANYRLAYETAVRPLSLVNPVYGSIAFPVMSKMKDDKAGIRNIFLKALKGVTALTFPMAAGLVVLADLAIPLFYGPNWQMAIPMLCGLGIVGALRTVGNLGGSVLLSQGKAGRSFALNALNLLVLGGGLYLAVGQGVQFMIWCNLLILVLIVIFTWHWIYWDTIQLSWREYVSSLFGPTLSSATMGIGLYLLRLAWRMYTKTPESIYLWIPAGVLIYVLFWWCYDRKFVKWYINALVFR